MGIVWTPSTTQEMKPVFYTSQFGYPKSWYEENNIVWMINDNIPHHSTSILAAFVGKKGNSLKNKTILKAIMAVVPTIVSVEDITILYPDHHWIAVNVETTDNVDILLDMGTILCIDKDYIVTIHPLSTTPSQTHNLLVRVHNYPPDIKFSDFAGPLEKDLSISITAASRIDATNL